MKSIWLTLPFLLTLPLLGTVTLEFSTFDNSLKGISDSTGSAAVNGLSWGIVVDTTGDGFPALAGGVGLNLNDGVDLGSGDLFFHGGTTDFWPFPVTAPGDGAIIAATSIDPYSGTGVTSGDNFAIIWFDTGTSAGSPIPAGTRYGMIQDAGLTVPPDGTASTDFSGIFAGTDATPRPADLELIPEPSSLLLLGLGLGAMARRRRR